MINAEKLAEFEIAWWEKYHSRDWKGLEKAVKDLRKEEYRIEISDATALYFARAAQEYIRYKKALAKGDTDTAKSYLSSARNYMARHYGAIEEMLK